MTKTTQLFAPNVGMNITLVENSTFLIFLWMSMMIMAKLSLCRRENLLSLTMSTSKMLHYISIA